MDSPFRSTKSARPLTTGPAGPQQDDGYAQLMGSAVALAHEAGQRVAMARNWFYDVALQKYPITTLGMAFGLGVFAGWFVKRR